MISPQSSNQSLLVTFVKGASRLLDMQSFKFRQANQSLHLLPVSGDKIPALCKWCMRILIVPTSDIVQYISEILLCRYTNAKATVCQDVLLKIKFNGHTTVDATFIEM